MPSYGFQVISVITVRKDFYRMSQFKRPRPTFPKKAVITAGMPYGNKQLHFGHVGGMFVHADTFARFMRDRIGKDNVLFVSGTDCYGSPALEGYRKQVEQGFTGSIEDYVEENHLHQAKTLKEFLISLDLFAASALGDAAAMHKEVSAELFQKLYDHGSLVKDSTPQFFDPEIGVFLNGRQVVGKCPFEGCTSEHGYADECALGHQYAPSELLNPVSTLSGKTPELREVTNWYFKLDEYLPVMEEIMADWKQNTNLRKYILRAIDEFLKQPIIYVQKNQIEDLEMVQQALPTHELINEEKKPSYSFVFSSLADRDKARAYFTEQGMRFRTGKTLVPFRLSGNCEWGVPVPVVEGQEDLTFWVWPESLWAPISFSRALLKARGADDNEWERYWKDADSKVYQFIGEDNIYFYGIAEMGMFLSYYADKAEDADKAKGVNLPHLVANKHILFMDKKASSSGAVKPPMAAELLDHYTAEQLRIHFLSLGLSTKNASFQPLAFQPEEERQGKDPALKEGNLLTNVFNRLVRSCFYTAQSYFDGKLPTGNITESVLAETEKQVLEFERHMYNHDFHRLTYVLDDYIRFMNKHWVNHMKQAEKEDDQVLRHQILLDCFHGVRTATTLLHAIAPSGCAMVQEYLGVSDELWNWEHIFEPLSYFCGEGHQLKFLEPRVDFFAKHQSQFVEE